MHGAVQSLNEVNDCRKFLLYLGVTIQHEHLHETPCPKQGNDTFCGSLLSLSRVLASSHLAGTLWSRCAIILVLCACHLIPPALPFVSGVRAASVVCQRELCDTPSRGCRDCSSPCSITVLYWKAYHPLEADLATSAAFSFQLGFAVANAGNAMFESLLRFLLIFLCFREGAKREVREISCSPPREWGDEAVSFKPVDLLRSADLGISVWLPCLQWETTGNFIPGLDFLGYLDWMVFEWWLP